MLITLATALSACSPPPQPRQRGILQHSTDPAFVHGTDHSQVDRIAATVVTDLQQYWAETFPRAFQQPWRDLDVRPDDLQVEKASWSAFSPSS